MYRIVRHLDIFQVSLPVSLSMLLSSWQPMKRIARMTLSKISPPLRFRTLSTFAGFTRVPFVRPRHWVASVVPFDVFATTTGTRRSSTTNTTTKRGFASSHVPCAHKLVLWVESEPIYGRIQDKLQAAAFVQHVMDHYDQEILVEWTLGNRWMLYGPEIAFEHRAKLVQKFPSVIIYYTGEAAW